MSGRTLNTSGIENELATSRFFDHKRQQKTAEKKRTGVQASTRSGEQVNRRTGVRKKELISEKTTRVPFNIFFEHNAKIDWYVNKMKKAGNKSYNKSLFVRELLDKFFEREKRNGRMNDYVNR